MRVAEDMDFLTLRYRFYDLVHKWVEDGLLPKKSYSTPQYLAELLGYRNLDQLLDNGNKDDVIHTLKLLNGPNGLAIYKMLMIKRGFK